MRVLVVGSGQLGTRHMQAVLRLPEVEAVDVVDPSEASLALGRERLAEAGETAAVVRFLPALEDAAEAPDLAVIATQAAGREELFERVVEATGVRRVLLEKVVAQSVAGYERMLGFAESAGVSAWVNCKSRAYGVHARIKSLLEPSLPVTMTDVGGAHGLGNNGVHAADLFAFYTGCDRIAPVGDAVEERLLPSKRGPEVSDLAGAIYGAAAGGSNLAIVFEGGHTAPDTVTVQQAGARWVVDHFTKTAWESREADGWRWTPLPVDEDWAVSRMTADFARDIVSKGACALPTLAEAYPGHRFILESLLPHFNRLLGRDSDVCPIT